ncbi:MAG TPA: hypothetical protein PLF08_06450 [Bacillota bacterium]|nr:hypothetical protein [Bacillota bacterium]HPZ78738.1 hypothetical protein [Bacillota bacterium]HQD74810.1 hypothetical protein [Bacillota bacterium]
MGETVLHWVPYHPISQAWVGVTAKPTSETLFCNKVNIRCAAYKIHGANYSKLRDIMKVMDIEVTSDSTRNSILIDTCQHYRTVSENTDAVKELK